MEKCNCNLNVITRRSFLDRSLKTSAAIALGTLMDIPLVVKRALAEGSIGLNGKKLLFIWLRGANDGLNSVVPILDSAYAPNRPPWQSQPIRARTTARSVRLIFQRPAQPDRFTEITHSEFVWGMVLRHCIRR
jgi:uncharacterized protein (DUF1501 family)